MTKHHATSDPIPSLAECDAYRRARRRARLQPTWWLRRLEAHIIAERPRPTNDQLAELMAIRRELVLRRRKPSPAVILNRRS